MTTGRSLYKIKHIVSCLLMMFALAWLTVSTPFVYEQMQKKHATAKLINMEDGEEECPLATTTEEKSESGMNTLSEYLHDIHIHDHSLIIKKAYNKYHPSDLYFAFHPELVSPPPKA